MQKKIKIQQVESWDEQEIVDLYKAGGWWKEGYDKSKLKSLIKRSFAFFVVIDKEKNKAVGMGRILSDGISDAYIQDLVILPKYRKKGIGSKLVTKLIRHCHKNDIRWISLISEPGQEEFYKKIGFDEMKKYTAMKYPD